MQRNTVISLGDGFITTNIFMLAVSSSKYDVVYDISFYIHISFLLFLENLKIKPTANKNKKCGM